MTRRTPHKTASRLRRALRLFRKREDGNATVEFAIVIPAFLFLLMNTVELGMITIQQSMLERALDQTVRGLRLSTGVPKQHNEIRDEVCRRSGFIRNCGTSLRLEMVQVDPYAWTPVDPVPDCINRVEDVQPVRNFVTGDSNELMFIRACMAMKPVFPHWGLADDMDNDADGRIRLYATSAFVQEPR
ncbi:MULTISPECIES: TadE/TadG family type IV pilus assembly protein [Phaeobacter]|uniref:TadE-like protein n=1 Tax=Phaeobacter piscinae TaxID=1580596 RepID=A0ABN5DCA2_9RHOB|nr:MULTISPECIES: TadE/TadG family type IV pilus assembly protein [Phaeobacter]ATG34950.1 TadE-like protein [Phaeobacter piscinae]ATG38912.1 TadE-like protein [Phaeobacter piscinae]AUQ85470.1 TadE-like protein [Phaeobacter piscinae]AUR23354.1 TadE-like protein [Phaeobacter piscinae]KII13589.1 pilus assembly protein TadE [Phaeobacter sp. S60]